MKITLIAAMDGNNGIGKNGKLPWHNPADLAHFKQYTDGKAVVMGRKTWESLPIKPISNRINFILSKEYDYRDLLLDGVRHGEFKVYDDLDSLLKRATPLFKELVVIGGGEIYKQFMPVATNMVLSQMRGDYDCDTFFPARNWDDWELVDVTVNYDFDIQYWERVK